MITNLSQRKDNCANIARLIIIGSVAGKASNRSMRSNCKRLRVSFRTLKQVICDPNFDNARFTFLMSRSREKTVLTEETNMMVTNFYNKVARECPYRKSTVLVYGQNQPVKFLEKAHSITSNSS